MIPRRLVDGIARLLGRRASSDWMGPDPARDAAEEAGLEGEEVGRHVVDRGHRPQRADILVGAQVAHDTDGLDRQEHGEGLPDLVVKAGNADLLEEDPVRLLQRAHPLRGDRAGDADGQPGAGEGVAAHEGLGQPQLAAQLAHLILEQLAQGLDQPQRHPLRQAADIVVALDRNARAAGEADGFDHIGIERALRKEFRAAGFTGEFFEDVDKGRANQFSFDFRLGNALERVQENLAGVFVDQRNIIRAAEHVDDLLGFIGAHHAGVDIDAGQLIAYRFVQ